MADKKKDKKTWAVDLHGPSRRDFIKYSVALGAFLGLERWKTFEALGDLGGPALADAAACISTNRSVHVVAGSAGFAWLQLLWPQLDIVDKFQAGFAYHDPGNFTNIPGTGPGNRLYLSKQAPWQSLPSSRQVSAFMAGTNQFTGSHLDNPTNSSTIDTGKGLFAACASLQAANPTLVPVIGVNGPANTAMPYGSFAGAPNVAQVSAPAAMVGLFGSSASSAMGPLANPNNASFFEAYYKGFLGLSRVAGRPTYASAFQVGKTAAQLIGVNLSSQLQPSVADQIRYGMSLSTPSNIADFGNTLITTAKAFQLGLTSCVMMPAFNDDPHGAFADMATLLTTITSIGTILDNFLLDLQVPDASCAGTTIADNLVMSFHTDTPKTPLIAAAWPDATPNACNWVYALGAGWLKSGWFGGVKADGTTTSFDPTTGLENNQNTSVAAMPAAGAIAYAVAKGDSRAVGDFYRGVDISGIVQPKLM